MSSLPHDLPFLLPNRGIFLITLSSSRFDWKFLQSRRHKELKPLLPLFFILKEEKWCTKKQGLSLVDRRVCISYMGGGWLEMDEVSKILAFF